jgi:hypothetical protein
LIERSKVGTASGLLSSIMALFLLILPLVFGWLVDHSQEKQKGYYDPMIMQFGISVLAICFNLLNYCYDRFYNERILALDVEERNKLFEAKKHRS